VEPETAVSVHMEHAEHSTAGDTQDAASENPNSSFDGDTSYAVIVKYNDCYLKSKDGFLRLLHLVSCCDFWF